MLTAEQLEVRYVQNLLLCPSQTPSKHCPPQYGEFLQHESLAPWSMCLSRLNRAGRQPWTMIHSAHCRMCHVTHCGRLDHATAQHCHDNRQSHSPRSDLSSHQFTLGGVLHLELWSFTLWESGGDCGGVKRCDRCVMKMKQPFCTVVSSSETDPHLI